MADGTIPTGTILDRIVADKRRELDRNKKRASQEQLRYRAEGWVKGWKKPDEQWGLADAIIHGPRVLTPDGRKIRLIAEIKFASPSKGRMQWPEGAFKPSVLATTYTTGGACGISVVTEGKHFLGDLRYMRSVRSKLRRRFPRVRPSVLRKDFLFDPYHIWEARAYGADAVLLIAAILEEGLLIDLIKRAQFLRMDALVEVHDEEEVEKALRAGAQIIGINNRDLRTFDVDLATTERLRPLIPADKLVVAESGIQTRADVERLADCGVHAILVGEALVTSRYIRAKMRELII